MEHAFASPCIFSAEISRPYVLSSNASHDSLLCRIGRRRLQFLGAKVAISFNSRPASAQRTEFFVVEAKKYSVGILGATGSVGQKFVQLLEGHPWFDVKALGASSRSAGKTYADAANWKQATPVPKDILSQTVLPCEPSSFPPVDLVFSGLDAEVAGPIEEEFAKAGIAVFSNAKNHRMDPDVPILIPFVNADHIDVIPHQKKQRGYDKGFIVTNANCSTTGLATVLKPLEEAFGLEKLLVFTMQAISGAGYPGLPSMDILDNVVPFIGGEEPKMETEPLKILGKLNSDKSGFDDAVFTVSAHCNRVHVLDGHTECASIKFKKEGVTPEQVVAVLQSYANPAQKYNLPSAPESALVVTTLDNRPQPRLDRLVGNGYTVTVGRVRPCNVFDIRLTLLSHNTIIGAAGGSILNAELAIVAGYIS